MPGSALRFRGRSRRVLAIAALAGLLLAALVLTVAGGQAAARRAGSAAHRGAQRLTPARETFRGSIVSSTGAYAGDHGRATVRLHPHGSGRSRTVRVRFRGRRCRAAQNCLDLRGSLVGRLTASAHQVPDTGTRYSLTGAGAVSPLGASRGAGHVEGTGFIARGRETLELTLRNHAGSVTLRAQSPVVRGFTSP